MRSRTLDLPAEKSSNEGNRSAILLNDVGQRSVWCWRLGSGQCGVGWVHEAMGELSKGELGARVPRQAPSVAAHFKLHQSFTQYKHNCHLGRITVCQARYHTYDKSSARSQRNSPVLVSSVALPSTLSLLVALKASIGPGKGGVKVITTHWIIDLQLAGISIKNGIYG